MGFEILEKIQAQATGATRLKTGQLRVLLATKTQSPERIAQALNFQQNTDPTRLPLIGENRVDELAKHFTPTLKNLSYERHFIGHLQRNKAREIVGWATMIHSIDSEALLTVLARRIENYWSQSPAPHQPLEFLVQVNAAKESTKNGVEPSFEAVAALVEAGLKHDRYLRPRGLMCIGANSREPQVVSDSFARTAELCHQASTRLGLDDFTELSMGMSHDYQLAIARGATIIRLGSAVFGPRPGNGYKPGPLLERQ